MLLAAVTVAGWCLVDRDGSSPAGRGPVTVAADPGDRAAHAHELLPALTAALVDARPGRLAGLTPTGATAATRELRAVAANVRALRIRDLSLTYVAASPVRLSTAQLERLGEDAWVADVRLTWRYHGVDRATSAVTTPLVLGSEDGRPVFETARVAGGGLSSSWWVRSRVVVRRTPDAVVVATEPGTAASLAKATDAAVGAVRAMLPGWHGRLVIEAPASFREFQRASGLTTEAARGSAAVTATTSTNPDGPVRIYVNPDLVEMLGPVGRRALLTHEAVHVALEAVSKPVPLWLSEGIADHIALRDSGVPVRALATQARRMIHADGLPDALPTAADLHGANPDAGGWYEAAWLAVRLLAERHGDAALLRFHERTIRDRTTDQAFQRVLGTTEAEFVEQWRDHLSTLTR